MRLRIGSAIVVLLPACRAIAGVSEDPSLVTTDAGPGTSVDAAADVVAPPARPDACARALACEDFERGALDGRWRIANGQGSVTVDGSRARHGARALHIHVAEVRQDGSTGHGTKAALSIQLPERAFLRVHVFASSPLPPNGLALLLVQQTVPPYRGINFHTLDDVLAVTNFSAEPHLTWSSSSPAPHGRWSCVEWRIDRRAATTEVWLDGSLVPELRTSGAAVLAYDEVVLAAELIRPRAQPAYDVWFDDLVVADAPIGCE